MTISIASTFYNDKKMLKLMMDSVLAQDYSDIEHIITDGGSIDGSVELLREYEKKYTECGKKLVWVSERDNGIYDGFNKAANMSSGDSLMFGSDPYYDTHSISLVISEMEEKNADYVYGGMIFQKDGKIIRQWSGKPGNWRFGWMAATPTFCMKRSVWEKYGPLDQKYKSASDYKFQILVFSDNTLKSSSIRKPIVIYYAGGTSNGGIKAVSRSINECQRILNECKVPFGWFTNLCKTIIALFAYTFASHKKFDLEEKK